MNSKNTINDMEILEKIIHNKIKIRDIDDEKKQKLINLCNERIMQIDKKLVEKDEEFIKYKKMLNELEG